MSTQSLNLLFQLIYKQRKCQRGLREIPSETLRSRNQIEHVEFRDDLFQQTTALQILMSNHRLMLWTCTSSDKCSFERGVERGRANLLWVHVELLLPI